MRLVPLLLFFSLAAASTASAVLELTGELLNYREKREPGEKAPVAMRPGPGPRPVTQNKVLNVTVRNASGRAEQGVTIRYWIIGRDPRTSKPALLDGGEAQLNLRSNGMESITSEPVKTTFTPPSVFRAGEPLPTVNKSSGGSTVSEKNSRGHLRTNRWWLWLGG